MKQNLRSCWAEISVRRRLKERLNRINENLYFIPMNEIGVKMMGIMTRRDWYIRLREALFGNWAPGGIPVRWPVMPIFRGRIITATWMEICAV